MASRLHYKKNQAISTLSVFVSFNCMKQISTILTNISLDNG